MTPRPPTVAQLAADPDVVAAVRDVLATIARLGMHVTYGTLAEALGPPWTARNLTPMLNAVGDLCAARGEPSLDSLVYLSSNGRPGLGSRWDRRDYLAERRACHAHHIPATEENP